LRRFLRYGALFLLILLVLGHVLDYMVTAGLRKSELPDYAEWNAVISGDAAGDVIIQGSSRAWVGISPAILGDRLGVSCYNLAVNGYPLDMELARYRLYREYDKNPKVIVQSVDTYSFTTRSDLFANNQFLPYFDEKAVREAIEPYGYFHWYDYDLPLVRYRGKVQLVWRGLAEFFGVRHYVNQRDRGYQPQDLQWSDEFDKFVAAHPNGYEQVWKQHWVDELDTFLAECGRDGIMVVLVYPPEYYGSRELLKNRDEIFSIFRQLAQKYGVLFLDYSYDLMANDTRYFYNSQHLNRLGSETFSAKLAGDLASLLKTAGASEAGRP
jgi:hypothetical protein